MRNDGSDGVMAAMEATAATVATVAVRRVGERRHEGNLADARTQPNNLTPLQNFAQGSARGQCPVVCMREKGAEGSGIVGWQRRGAGKSSKKRGGQREGIRRKLQREKKNLINV